MRVDRTFAFIDLCGFTAFTEEHGDERAVLVLGELRRVVREAAARRGVRVVKWLGDGAMLSSTIPEAIPALVVEVDRRMNTAISSLAVRAGMDHGPVIMFEGDDYIGRPVNVAARLCDVAAPHEILVTTAAADRVPPWLVTAALPDVELRGIGGLIEIRSVRQHPPSDEDRTDPVCGLEVPERYMVIGEGPMRFCSDACAGARPRRASAEAPT